MLKLTDSLISNIENKDRDLIVEAIKLSGFSDIVYIKDVATYAGGKILKVVFGVHTKDRSRDHHNFWKKFDTLQAQQKKQQKKNKNKHDYKQTNNY